VLEDEQNRRTLGDPALAEDYNFNQAAAHDLRAAIAEMRARGVTNSIAVVGHCMGAGILAEAIARGCLAHEEIDCVVLSTLGLFYITPIDSRLKSEDRVLERLAHTSPKGPACATIDPRVKDVNGTLETKWHDDIEALFKSWPVGVFHDDGPALPDGNPAQAIGDSRRIAHHTCNRLSFMYGVVFRHDNLADDFHEAGTHANALNSQFGGIPLHMYIHAARNIRHGRATFYRPRPGQHNDEFVSPQARAEFMRLKKVTLITGALNRLWHRDSVDLMFEWLKRRPDGDHTAIEKVVFPTYGHQDLLWGRTAAADVYPTILQGLRP
jgi:hypothetical protein